MSTNLLAFPFHVPKNGSAETVEQGSPEYYDQQIAVIVSTETGERELHPELGIPDIAFRGFQFSALEAQVSTQFPEVVGLLATITTIDDRTQNVVITYDVAKDSDQETA